MNEQAPSRHEWASRRCVPCEGDVPRIDRDVAAGLLGSLPGWALAGDGDRIRRAWKARDFAAGVRFLGRVADLAEAEGHHPDLHLVDYRLVSIEIRTHAIGGLSENDFILAAKIDRVADDPAAWA